MLLLGWNGIKLPALINVCIFKKSQRDKNGNGEKTDNPAAQKASPPVES